MFNANKLNVYCHDSSPYIAAFGTAKKVFNCTILNFSIQPEVGHKVQKRKKEPIAQFVRIFSDEVLQESDTY